MQVSLDGQVDATYDLTDAPLADALGDDVQFSDGGDIDDTSGNELLEFDLVASAVNFFRMQNAATTANPVLSAQGEADTGMEFHNDQGEEILILEPTATAVNELTIKSAATGNNPIIMASGEADTGITFMNLGSEEILILDSVATSVNELTVRSAATGNKPIVAATGEADNGIEFHNDQAEEILILNSVATSVNELTIHSAATGTKPIIAATGEADNGIEFHNDQAEEILILQSAATSVNELTVTSGATGVAPLLSATGGDANIDLRLEPKGTGTAQVYSDEAGATGAVLELFQESASPAALDVVGGVSGIGMNDAAGVVTYGQLGFGIVAPNNGAEVGGFSVSLQDGGAALPGIAQFSVNGGTGSIGVTREDDGAEGAAITLAQVSASPAVNDEVGYVKFVGNDDGAGASEYSQIAGIIDDATAGAEFGRVIFKGQNGTGGLRVAGGAGHDGSYGYIAAGAGDGMGEFKSQGDFDVMLKTGNATTGSITITDGAAGAISIEPEGVGLINTTGGGITSSANIGAPASSGVVATEFGDGHTHVTQLALTDYIVGPLAGAAAAKVLIPPEALYTFPAGAHILSATFSALGLTAAGTAVSPDMGLGSVAGDGSAFATLNLATIGITVEDTLTGYTVADTVTHAEVASGPITPTAGALAGIALSDGGTSKDLFLNAAATWNADNTGNLTATGVVVINWTTMAT
jgi:hypothetical protein